MTSAAPLLALLVIVESGALHKKKKHFDDS